MKDTNVANHAPELVDRLWRAYAPFQRGRNMFGDLTAMLSILMLARFVESAGSPVDDFVLRWKRAVAEAPIGVSPLRDLRAAMWSAGRHPRFPAPELDLGGGFHGGDDDSDGMPWVADFLTVLDQHSTLLAEIGLPEVYELLLERHVQESTVSAGEFHTPRPVVRLLVEVLSPEYGDRILDPACGTGGLLAATTRRLAEFGSVDGASIEAYAADHINPRLAMMNLAIHGVNRPVVRAADSVSLFRSLGNGLVDGVLSNPPFNQRFEDVDSARWPFGPPPEFNANFAWLQLAWSRLSASGTAVMVMPPRAAWSNGREAEIRRRMISSGAVLGIISLPPNLFTHTSIPVHIWILARNKPNHLPPEDADAVLFIDASLLGTQMPRQPRVLDADDIERISSRFVAWRRAPGATPDESGFSRSVGHEEILENEGSLDPRLYVESAQKRRTTAVNMSRMFNELDRHDETTSGSSVDIRKSFSICERFTRSSGAPPRPTLKSIVNGTVEGVSEDSVPGLLLTGPSGTLISARDYVGEVGGIPVVMPKDLIDNSFSVADIKYIAEYQAEGLERFRLRCGDVVLARRGELGRCAVVREGQRGWVCGTGCFLLRPPAELDADYFAAYIRSSEAREWLETHSTGTTLQTISLDVLAELPVALPDLGTQQAIARAMTRLDERDRILREQIELTQEIRRNALNGLLAN